MIGYIRVFLKIQELGLRRVFVSIFYLGSIWCTMI